MREVSDQEKLVEIYLVLSDLRCLMHKESNTLEDFQTMARKYYKRVANGAAFAAEMLPEDVVERLDEA